MSHDEPTQTDADSEGQAQVPEPEVLPRAKRRQFSAEYKLRILEEADSCTERGQIGGLLRREGVLAENSHPPRFQSQSASTTFEVCVEGWEIVSSWLQSAVENSAQWRERACSDFCHRFSGGGSLLVFAACGRLGLRGFQAGESGDTACV
jgi:hypothetical protein